MTVTTFEEILTGKRSSLFTRSEFWKRTQVGPMMGDEKAESGYHVQMVNGGRMARATAAKRVPVTRGADIATVPFGYLVP